MIADRVKFGHLGRVRLSLRKLVQPHSVKGHRVKEISE